MARFSRLEVLNRIIGEGIVPVFYHADPAATAQVVGACAQSGISSFEFTNRGDQAIETFKTLVQTCRKQNPDVILGVGSIVEEATAALFIAQGANFIVGPSFNPAVALLCNRRKIPYLPGCATASEISEAESLGVEIVKLFPCEAAGGPGFVKALLGPCPWTRIMPTGMEVVNPQSLGAWFKAGVAAVGLGRALIAKEALDAGDYASIARRAAEITGWVRDAKKS
jgi:2-dehydro-3-deoxyphosphogluconate aldolase/(4S)-4-hydroxy-2-oxoglutarate aldolase